MNRTTRALGLMVCISVVLIASLAAMAQKHRQDTIKVSKRFYVASNQTLLINSVSSDKEAHLYLYKTSGAPIGEVQNGSGGKYGGTVFFIGKDPQSLTIVSSFGGKITFNTEPFHP